MNDIKVLEVLCLNHAYLTGRGNSILSSSSGAANIVDVDGKEQPRFWFCYCTCESVRGASICGSELIRAKSESESAVRMYNVTF